MLAWACVLGLLGLSAPTKCSSEFFYSRVPGNPNSCSLCFEKNCLIVDKARCDYYTEAGSLLSRDEEEPGGIQDAVKRLEVDSLMHDLVGKELPNTMECIPYVSRYTNCNKDNVCLGCESCACSPAGQWNCTTLQPCHNHEPLLNIDHRVLMMVIEALTDTAPKKTKRSVNVHSEEMRKTDVTDNTSSVSMEKLSRLLYGVNPLTMEDVSPTDTTTDFTNIASKNETGNETKILTTEADPVPTISEVTTVKTVKDPTTSSDADYIAFADVLRDIAVDINSIPDNNTRRKLLDDKNNDPGFSVEYMIMNEENATSGPNNFAMNLTLNSNDPESTVAGVTKVVIDLLETARRLGANANATEGFTHFNKDDYPDVFEDTNDILNFNSLNVMKREVTDQENITEDNVGPTVTVVDPSYITTAKKETIDLSETVLTPINKIIANKMGEYDNLQKIKENLLKFVKQDQELHDIIKSENNTTVTDLSMYNITGLNINLRRANPDMYKKYMLKLKHDIFEVIRDIVAIQKSKNLDLPKDLKILLNAMKWYVYKNKLNKPSKKSHFRRNMETRRCDGLSFKDCLLQIIKVIDKDIPKSNALFPLSANSKKIIQHVIKTYYIGQLAMPGMTVHDPHYNVTHYLNTIGSRWTDVTANLIGSIPFGSLHRMKLLHCILTVDVNKMSDALSLIEFARNRQILSSLDNVDDDLLDKIDTRLFAVHNKIQLLTQYYEQIPVQLMNEQPQEVMEITTKDIPSSTIENSAHKHKKKSRSFIKHIRSLLKASKKDIAKILHKDVPKSEIVKELAKKRLNEMTDKRYSEYEETMRRWQQNLELIPRVKRSNLDNFLARTKNIIPKYLRHKVNPRIKLNRKKTTADVKKKKNETLRLERKAKNKTTTRSRKNLHAPKHTPTVKASTSTVKIITY